MISIGLVTFVLWLCLCLMALPLQILASVVDTGISARSAGGQRVWMTVGRPGLEVAPIASAHVPLIRPADGLPQLQGPLGKVV